MSAKLKLFLTRKFREFNVESSSCIEESNLLVFDKSLNANQNQ